MSGILGIGGGGDAGFYSFPLEQSLRFNDDDTAMLSKTFASAGDRRTWTWSGWVKRGNLGNTHPLFVAGSSGSSVLQFALQTSTVADRLVLYNYTGSYDLRLDTDQVFRDVSGWYHIVLKMDTTQATSSNRMKLYVNGDEVTSFSTSSYPSQNFQTLVNSAASHRIGRNFDTASTSKSLDGYLAEVNFIDGTALDASYFGETKSGIWIPKQFTGSYGTNGFRLTFDDDTTVEGFNTVLYNGNGATKSVQGVGFSPDLVWLKNRDSTYAHALIDSVRGATKSLSSNLTNAERTSDVTSLDSDGFSLQFVNATGTFSENQTNQRYAAWCWDAGGAPTADNSAGQGNVPTAGSVKIDGANSSTALSGTLVAKRISANTTRGFSIVTFNSGSTDNVTLDHGLGAVPKWIITRPADNSGSWLVYHSDQAADPSLGYLSLEGTGAFTDDDRIWNDTMPTSTLVTLGNVSYSFGDNRECVMYCWSEISGYSKFGSYIGSGSTGKKITTGFKPAFVLVKSYDQTRNWIIWDNTRTTTNPADGHLHPSANVAEQTGTDEIQFDSDGFTFLSGDADSNQSGYNYIYAAFADTREYAFWTDQSGNNNDFQHDSLEHTDVVPDNPTNNRVTFNALAANLRYTTTLSEGNKTIHFTAANNGFSCCPSTIFRSEGQAYIEFELDTAGSGSASDNQAVCVFEANAAIDDIGGGGNSKLAAAYIGGSSSTNAVIYDDGVSQGNPTKFTTAGQRIGVYIDYDAGKGFFSHDGTVQTVNGTPDISAGTNPHFTFTANTPLSVGAGGIHSSGTPAKITMHDNPDDWETTPTGYTAFATAELPDPGIDPNKGDTADEYFNTVTYTGTGASTLSITGVGFQPDWVWAKKRSATDSHATSDVVRGVTKTLFPDVTNAESTDANGLQSFDSDGFTVGSGSGSGVWGGNSGATYVAWNWKAGGSDSTNGDGSLTSQVSVNTEAGFSIVAYSGSDSAATVGHGLGVAPDFVLVKQRTATGNWIVGADIPDWTWTSDYLLLDDTAAKQTNAGSTFFTGAPTSTVLNLGGGSYTSSSSQELIAYCFAEIEGYSKVGTYTGNGSSDGAFVYTGFKPAWVMLKRTNTTGSWKIFDNKRPDPFNVIDARIEADNNGAESTSSSYSIDLISNGFKLRGTSAEQNGNGSTFMYLAFAEQPFKYANAR